MNVCFMKVFSCANKVTVNVKHQGICGKIVVCGFENYFAVMIEVSTLENINGH